MRFYQQAGAFSKIPAGAALTLLLTITLCSFSACSSQEADVLAGTLDIHKGSPVVYIHPAGGDYSLASIGVLPFQIPDNMTMDQGTGIASLYKDVLLGKRAFQTVKLLETPYADFEEAISLGIKSGVDLVLAGRINYAMEGTALGGARVEAAVRIINVKSRNTVWYIGQTMAQDMDYPDVSFSGRLLSSFSQPPVKGSGAASPMTNMLVRIAEDMTLVMAGATSVNK